MVIGKKGARIKEIEKSTGMKSVNVDGKTGKITVVGPDYQSVLRAREQLELFEESFDLDPACGEFLGKRRYCK